MVFKDSNVELIASFRLSQNVTGAVVKSIEFARRGRLGLTKQIILGMLR